MYSIDGGAMGTGLYVISPSHSRLVMDGPHPPQEFRCMPGIRVAASGGQATTEGAGPTQEGDQ
jgi:hypothetical protein